MIELLKQQAIFANLTEGELNELVAISSRKHYEKGDLVFEAKQKAHFLFLVEKGAFNLHLVNNVDKVLTEGAIFGEIGIINKNMRTGTIRAIGDASVIAICGTKLFQEEYVKPTTSLKVIRSLAVKITNYLRSREQISTKELIELGETDHVEFKSTLRWNLYTNKKDKAIEHAALKTITAFLNSKGGTLLVGVKDNGELLDLKTDNFENDDKLMLHVTKLIKDKIGTLQLEYVEFDIEEIEGKQVLRIDCQPSTFPAYLTDGNDDSFYIRTGPATTNLRVSKVYTYVKHRFYPEED